MSDLESAISLAFDWQWATMLEGPAGHKLATRQILKLRDTVSSQVVWVAVCFGESGLVIACRRDEADNMRRLALVMAGWLAGFTGRGTGAPAVAALGTDPY